MTLAQWSKKYDVATYPYGPPVKGPQAWSVFSNDYRDHPDAGWDLAHLSDYAISSRVSGPQVCWFR